MISITIVLPFPQYGFHIDTKEKWRRMELNPLDPEFVKTNFTLFWK
jgi:hypothetical protein